DVGLIVEFRAADDDRTGLGVSGVGVPGCLARAFLDQYIDPGGHQLRHGLRHQAHPPFPGRVFLDDSNLHAATLSPQPEGTTEPHPIGSRSNYALTDQAADLVARPDHRSRVQTTRGAGEPFDRSRY